MKRVMTALAVACAAMLLTTAVRADQADAVRASLAKITLPDGFRIALYAMVPGARSMAVDPASGAVFVGSRGRMVHVVLDANRDGVADTVRRLADGLHVPNGIAIHDGWLYIAEQDRIVRWKIPADIGAARALSPLATVYRGLPDKGHHGSRYIAFGPDGRLYVGIGSPCNVCTPLGLEGSILRMDPDGGNVQKVATGIRNTVGFAWHPKTGVMYFTDNGADNMGDDSPPDELNKLMVGGFYGFPIYGGGTDRTPQMRNRAVPANAIPPVVAFHAHTASLGVAFYTGTMFPAAYRNDAFVAQHGSWNRSVPIGYRIMHVRFDAAGDAVGKQVFASGFLRPDGEVTGRPVDIKQLADGSLLVSDDYVGAIYRITYAK